MCGKLSSANGSESPRHPPPFGGLGPVLHDAWGTRVLYLESLRDLRVKDIVSDEDLARIRIEIEPTFVSLGSSAQG